MQPTWRFVKKEQITERWNQICLASETATFFHTTAWANVVKTTFSQWTPTPIAVEFSDGNLMVLPLMRRKGLLPLEHYGESMPPGVYGGPVFMKKPSEDNWRVVRNEVSRLSNFIIYGNPFLSEISFPDSSQRPLFTQVLDLAPGINRIMKDFRKGHSADLKAAQRNGVRAIVASSMDQVDAYFAIYQNTLARWGQKAGGFYPRRLFHNLFRLPEYGKSVKLWLATHQGRVIAGGWMFYHNKHAVYWHSAVHSDYMPYHPVHLLITEAIAESCVTGLRWFDLSPSGGHAGVVHFKRGFGAKPLEFFSYRRLGPMGKAFRFKRYIREAILHTCPL